MAHSMQLGGGHNNYFSSHCAKQSTRRISPVSPNLHYQAHSQDWRLTMRKINLSYSILLPGKWNVPYSGRCQQRRVHHLAYYQSLEQHQWLVGWDWQFETESHRRWPRELEQTIGLSFLKKGNNNFVTKKLKTLEKGGKETRGGWYLASGETKNQSLAWNRVHYPRRLFSPPPEIPITQLKPKRLRRRLR